MDNYCLFMANQAQINVRLSLNPTDQARFLTWLAASFCHALFSDKNKNQQNLRSSETGDSKGLTRLSPVRRVATAPSSWLATCVVLPFCISRLFAEKSSHSTPDRVRLNFRPGQQRLQRYPDITFAPPPFLRARGMARFRATWEEWNSAKPKLEAWFSAGLRTHSSNEHGKQEQSKRLKKPQSLK